MDPVGRAPGDEGRTRLGSKAERSGRRFPAHEVEPLLVAFLAGAVAFALLAPPVYPISAICPDGGRILLGSDRPWTMLGGEGPVRTAAICVDREGIASGPTLIWIDDRFAGVAHSRDGKDAGTSLLFDERGNVWLTTRFDENGHQIETSLFGADGAIDSRMTLDPADGSEVMRVHHPSGVARAEYHYQADRLDGPYVQWYPTGRMRVRGQWADGSKVGTWRCWNESGDQSIEIVWSESGGLLVAPHLGAQQDWMQACLTGAPGARRTRSRGSRASRTCIPVAAGLARHG